MEGNAQLVADNLGWMPTPSGQLLRTQDLGDQLTVNIPDALLMDGSAASPLTVEARIYPRAYKAYSVNSYPVVALRQSWESSLELLDGSWNSPAVPSIRSSGFEIVSDDAWSANVSTDAWHSLRITFDVDGQVEAYVDGALLGVQPVSMNYSRDSDWELSLGNFDGDIDEIRISNVVRTDSAATVASGLVVASIPDTIAAERDTLDVPIRLGDTTGEDVLGVEASVAYDATVVTVLDTLITTGSLTQSGWFGASNIVSGIGGIDTLKIGLASAQDPLVGSGPLVFFRLVAGGSQFPDTTALQIPSVSFNEGIPTAGLHPGSAIVLESDQYAVDTSTVAITSMPT